MKKMKERPCLLIVIEKNKKSNEMNFIATGVPPSVGLRRHQTMRVRAGGH
jgi:hypothetical protein